MTIQDCAPADLEKILAVPAFGEFASRIEREITQHYPKEHEKVYETPSSTRKRQLEVESERYQKEIATYKRFAKKYMVAMQGYDYRDIKSLQNQSYNIRSVIAGRYTPCLWRLQRLNTVLDHRFYIMRTATRYKDFLGIEYEDAEEVVVGDDRTVRNARWEIADALLEEWSCVLFDEGLGISSSERTGRAYLAMCLAATQWNKDEMRARIEALIEGRGE